MPTPDDELRELFAQGRAADRASAPSFEDTWAAAQDKRGSGLRIAVAIAVAAAILLIAGWLVVGPKGSDEQAPAVPEIAETNPVPDVPAEDEVVDEAKLDHDLSELAAWDPSFDSPTDFLLEEDGVLGGGMPTDLSDSVLDLDELTMEL